MSRDYKKIIYRTEGNFGSTVNALLYAECNNSCDVVSIYSESGDLILCYSENIGGDMDMGQALVKLLTEWDSQERMTSSEIDFINNKKEERLK
jgi:hypothetical protein